MSCSKKSNGCNNARKYKTLDWEFFPPTVGVIENIVINFSNGYDCYVPVLFIGDKIEETFKFDRLINKYVLSKPVCVPECSSKPYTIKVTAHSPCKIERPIIEINFVAHKRNEVEKYLDDDEIIYRIIINDLNRVCEPQLFYDGHIVGNFEYDAENNIFIFEGAITNQGKKIPYVVKTVDDCVCGSECVLDKMQIDWIDTPNGTVVKYLCRYKSDSCETFFVIQTPPTYKNVKFIRVGRSEEFPNNIRMYAAFSLDPSAPRAYLEYIESPDPPAVYAYLRKSTIPFLYNDSENPQNLFVVAERDSISSCPPYLCGLDPPSITIQVDGELWQPEN